MSPSDHSQWGGCQPFEQQGLRDQLNGGSVTIIDGNTNQVLQTLPVPAAFPNTVAVDLANGLTYVTDCDADQVIVLQPN